MDDARELRAWLTLHMAPGLGPLSLKPLLEHYQSAEAICLETEQNLRGHGLRLETIHALHHPDEEAIREIEVWQAQTDAYVVHLDHPLYPARLREINDPPLLLYVYGDPTTLSMPQIGIVGSRSASHTGQENARAFAAELSQSGLAVTSGMALGIDAAAHEGALAVGGRTLAVMGTGIDRVYPARHRQLAHRIAEQGALISEFPLTTPPLPGHFPRRNRLISGLSLGVLVVEASLQSGSLITAQQALEQNREVFAIPGSIHDSRAKGSHALIRQGAKLVETAADILEELSWSGSLLTAITQTKTVPALDDSQWRVLEAVAFAPTTVDTVVERCGLTPEAVCSILLVLELHGLVVAAPGACYQRTASEVGDERKRTRRVDVSL